MKVTAMRVAVSACVLAAAVAANAIADDTKPTSESSATGLSDMKVARDKNTGKMRAPTAEERAELDVQARSIAPSVVVLSRPISTVEYRADGSAVGKRTLADMDDLKLTTSDGKQVLSHSDGATTTEDAATPAEPTHELPQE